MTPGNTSGSCFRGWVCQLNPMRRKRPTAAAQRPKARAADVLSPIAAKVRVRPKWQTFYTRLMDLRNHLVNRKDQLAKDAVEERPTYSMHMADAGTDEFD